MGPGMELGPSYDEEEVCLVRTREEAYTSLWTITFIGSQL